MDNDFYGNNTKHFIGIVKNVNDPLKSNRVQVRILGIHPMNGASVDVNPSTSPNTVVASIDKKQFNLPNTNRTVPGIGSTPLAVVPVDTANLPNSSQLSMKISQNFTLGQLTTQVLGSNSKRTATVGLKQGLLTPTIIHNLANLTVNVLDALHAHYGAIKIISGWRIGVSEADNNATGGNHPNGYAADIEVNGVSPAALAGYIRENLHGHYNFLMTYRRLGHVHVQLGGTSRQGSLSNPVFISNG